MVDNACHPSGAKPVVNIDYGHTGAAAVQHSSIPSNADRPLKLAP